MEIRRGGPVSEYRQIAELIIGRIRSGDLRADDAIPSESDLVDEFGVARNTARRAVAVLRDEGWVYTVHARGSYVSENRPE